MAGYFRRPSAGRASLLGAVPRASTTTDTEGEEKMSATLAISIAVVTLGSCLASYMIGRDSMRQEFRDFQERRRRWEEFDDED